MSQYPPLAYPQPDVPGAPVKTSASAITSLVLGLLGCVPLLTSLLAVIFGIVGIRATRRPEVRGRGLAVAGLILGIAGIAGWSIFGGASAMFYIRSKPAAEVAQQFTRDIAKGDVATATTRCDARMKPEELEALAEAFKKHGTFQDLALIGRNWNATGSETTWNMEGIITFSGGRRSMFLVLHKQTDGSYKVSAARVE